MKFIFLILLLFSFFFGCNASKEIYKYEPEYGGGFVNSELQLQGWYLIPEKYAHLNDSVRSSFVSPKYYLAEYDSSITGSDSIILGFNVLLNKKRGIKQYYFRNTNDPASKFTTGFTVEIRNFSNDTLMFTGQDGSIMMIQEAIDPNGNWKPIEYWQSSFCGNSAMIVFFPPSSKMEFSAFRYEGDFKTSLRFKLLVRNQDKNYTRFRTKTFYSQPFKGSVYYSQFEIKKEPFINYLD